MSDQYVGEIRIFGGNFAPVDWRICDGSLLPIADYQVLYTLLGTTYGGDGITTFALPDLRGRIPINQGQSGPGPSYVMGQKGGAETVALTSPQLPSHQHAMQASTGTGNNASPTNNIWAQAPAKIYSTATAAATMDPLSVGQIGQGVAHDNMLPFLSINFIIASNGLFPSRD